MLKKLTIAAAAAAMFALPAMAGEQAADCATMLKQVQEKAAAASLDEQAAKAVAELRAKAEEQLKAGDEKGCKATAGELLKALGG